MHRQKLILQRKFCDLCGFQSKHWVRDDEHSSTMGLRNRFKGYCDLFRAARLEHVSTQIQRLCSCFHLACRACMVRIGWVHEQCNHLQARHGLLEELHAFGENVETHTKRVAGHVPARSREALDKAACDRIRNRNRHDGYRAGGLSGSHNCWRILCDDDVYLLLDELRREASQSVVVAFCIAKFEGNIPALDVAEVFKALAKRREPWRKAGKFFVAEAWAKGSKPANFCLLPALLSQGYTGAY